jgi:glycosyltransferase involved in cell wall biosynthesis
MNCYNGEAFLRESIESVLSQTYENWELIFWDNRSEDKSAEIFRNYNDKRFKYYYASKHTLLYEARNEAIKRSSGDFIAFLDTDDFWQKDKLELQLPLFKDPKVGVVYGNIFIINEALNTKKILLKGRKPRGLILDELLKNYCTPLVTLVIRRSFLDNYQPVFDNSFHIMGDYDLMIRMSVKYKFDCIEKPIASYRIHNKNESLLNRSKQIKELKTWYKKMINYPIIFNNENFTHVINKLNDFEIVNYILENDLKNAWLKIKKMPYSLKKIKYLLALLLPNNFVKRFT